MSEQARRDVCRDSEVVKVAEAHEAIRIEPSVPTAQDSVMNSSAVTFSIIIPTYRRFARLRSCLEALANLDYPPPSFEVLVVNDDSSAPELDALARCFDNRLQLNC